MSSYLTLHSIKSVFEDNSSRERLKKNSMIHYSGTIVNDK